MPITTMEVDAVKEMLASAAAKSGEASRLLEELRGLIASRQPLPKTKLQALYRLLIDLKMFYTHETSKAGISQKLIYKIEQELKG